LQDRLRSFILAELIGAPIRQLADAASAPWVGTPGEIKETTNA
jgi:hypothetical protein